MKFKLEKFTVDLLWNYVSLAILASSGILINLIIAYNYGAADLGRFNLIYAIYIFLSQFCIGGIHYSVLQSLAVEQSKELCIKQSNIGSALFLALVSSCIISLLLYLSRSAIGAHLGGATVIKGIQYLAPALVFFALNKVLLAVFNGLRMMRLYAIGQALRYSLMLAVIVMVSYFKLSAPKLAWSFFIAELVLFFVLALIVMKVVVAYSLSCDRVWLKKHFHFGRRAFMVGVFIEINSRIDVLLLGLFVTNTQVGIYSFGAMIAEGLSMFLVVIRNNANPLFATYLSANNFNELFIFIRKLRNYTYVGILPLTFLLIAVFPFIVFVILKKPEFYSSWYVLIILSSGIWLASGYLPCTDILTQANMPTCQTKQNALVVVSNVVLNLMLIPSLGIYGSAIATVFSSYLLAIYYLSLLVKKNLGFNLFSLQRISISSS